MLRAERSAIELGSGSSVECAHDSNMTFEHATSLFSGDVRHTRSALTAVFGAACLFGSTGTIASIGPNDLSPVAAGVWRSVIGAVLLAAAARVHRHRVEWSALANRWAWIGGVGVAGYQLAFFEAVDRTSVALGTVITIGVGPIVAGFLDASLRRRVPTRAWFCGTSIAVGGVALLTTSASDPDVLGIVLALAAACSFPLYGEAAQRLMVDRPYRSAMASVFGAGALLLSPIAVVTADDVLASEGSIATVVALGVATLAVAYLLWGFGLRALSLSTVVTVTLVEPAVAATLSVLVLDEAFTAVLVAGVSMVAIGVWLGTRGEAASARDGWRTRRNPVCERTVRRQDLTSCPMSFEGSQGST